MGLGLVSFGRIKWGRKGEKKERNIQRNFWVKYIEKLGKT